MYLNRLIQASVIYWVVSAGIAFGQTSSGPLSYFDIGNSISPGNELSITSLFDEEIPLFVVEDSEPIKAETGTPIPDAQHLYHYSLGEDEPSIIESLGRRPRDRRSLGSGFARLRDDFVADQRNFYGAANLRLLLGAFAIGAATANTSLDESLRDVLQENLVYTPSDEYAEFLHAHHYVGDGHILIPVFVTLAVVGKGLMDDPNAYVIGEWSERTFRGMLAGAPALLLSQSLTGASRPGETGHASSWRPFSDDNGVSGHSFMGAIPFLTAARMSDKRWVKIGFYAASILPACSRITDNRHYPSQAFLGWTLAYVATSSVAQTESGSGKVEFAPMRVGDDFGFGLTLRR
jgi:hypothetical protein